MRADTTIADANIAAQAKSWPYEEARRLHHHLNGAIPAKGHVLFCTGYGPSGLPHIGTFSEVLRTSLVQRAFLQLYGMPTRMLCVSDDLDALRKVPENVPQKEMLQSYIGHPVSRIPDPFGIDLSFGHRNTGLLKEFIQRFADLFCIKCEHLNASDAYKNGLLDDVKMDILRNHQLILTLMQDHLGEERQKTYAPFLPISERTGKVLQVPLSAFNADQGTITFEHEGEQFTISVRGDACKLQWKPDWAGRWLALGVDYEMHGKDLIASYEVCTKIAHTLGGVAPVGFAYELFLDGEGRKISKSKGNGLSIEEWLMVGSSQSIAHYIFQSPKKAKKLHPDAILKAEDEYAHNWTALRDGLIASGGKTTVDMMDNPVWQLHEGHVPFHPSIAPSLLANLALVSKAETADDLHVYVQRALGRTGTDADEERALWQPWLERSIRYAQTYLTPKLNLRSPSADEAAVLESLRDMIVGIVWEEENAFSLQSRLFRFAESHAMEAKSLFVLAYACLFGQSEGPRLGSFLHMYGKEASLRLIDQALMRHS